MVSRHPGGGGQPLKAVAHIFLLFFEEFFTFTILQGWDACMTWTLKNGTVVLQNFVMKDEDCTPVCKIFILSFKKLKNNCFNFAYFLFFRVNWSTGVLSTSRLSGT